jgi:hypothetical protein
MADQTAKLMADNEQYYYLFKKHPWIRACIRIIGNAVAQEGHTYTPVDEDKSLDDYTDLINEINAFLRIAFIGKCNTFRRFRKTIVIDCQTYAVGYAHRKYGAVDGKKIINGLERLNPLRIKPVLASDKQSIEFYAVKKTLSGDASGPVQQAAAQFAQADDQLLLKIPAAEMMVFTLDEGGDDILPSPAPLEALDLTAATDLSVRKHRKKLFENGTTLGNVLTSATANADQARELQNKLKRQAGGDNGFRNIAAAGDWRIENLMQSGGRDFDFIKGSELTIEEICAVFSMPPSKLRNVSGSMGQAGKGEDDETFEQECVLPVEESFYETLTIELLQKEFQIDDLSFAPQRRNKIRLDRFDAAIKGVKFGMSGNQALDLVGIEKSDAEGMDVPLFIGATGQGGIVDDEIDPTTQAPLQPPGTQGGDDVTDPDDVENENTNAPNKTKPTATKARIRGRKSAANPKARANWF